MFNLIDFLKEYGERLPKKHGWWYKIHAYDNLYLVLDTWNSSICIHEGCEDSGTDNLYRVIYTFSGYKGVVKKSMENFWYGHIYHKKFGN